MRKVNQLKFGVVLSYLAMIIQNVISIVYTPVMLRILGQSEYGLYNLVFSIVSYLGLLSFGFGSAFMRYYSRYKAKDDKEGMSKINGMFIIIFTIISLIILVVGILLIKNIDYIFRDSLNSTEIETARILMILMIINLAITFPGSVFDSIIAAHEKFIFQKIILVVKSILNPFLTLPLLLLGYKSVSLVIVTTLLTIGTLVLNMWYSLSKLKARFIFRNLDFRMMKEMWIFSFYIFINMITDQINWSVDKFILGVYQGTIGVAIYSIGAQINTYYLTFSTTISSVFIPKINQMVTNEEECDLKLTNLFIKVGRIQFIIMSLILTGFIFFGKFFIKIWAGEGYSNAYYIALILIIPVTIPLIQNLGIEIQKAKNKHKFRSIMYLLIAICNVFMSIPLCRYWGGIGTAIGTAISLIIGNILIMNIYYHKCIGLNIIRFWREIFSIAKGLIIPIIFGYMVKCFFEINNIYTFILLIVGYTIVFIISMWFFGMNNYEKELIGKPFIKLKDKYLRGREI